MINGVEGSREIKENQRGNALAVHGKTEIILNTSKSGFSETELSVGGLEGR